MSSLVRPVAAKTSWKIGTSISTPFVVAGECRSFGAWAKPITATSVMCCVLRWRSGGSQVVSVGVVARVWLPARLEVVDVVRPRAPLLPRLPHPPAPHAHPDLVGRAAEDQVLEGDVRAVDHDRRLHVRRGHPLTLEGDVHHADLRHAPL